MNLLLISASLFMISSAILLASVTARPRVEEVNSNKAHGIIPESFLSKEMFETKVLLKSKNIWNKQKARTFLDMFDLMLRQGGCLTRDQKIIRLTSIVSIQVLSLTVVSVYLMLSASTTNFHLWKIVLLFFVILFAGYGYLAHRVTERTNAINARVETLIQVTKMFWNTGMTLESVFKHSIDSLRNTSMEICEELSSVLMRIESGANRSRALEEIAQIQKSKIFASYLIILAQASETGGGVIKTLSELSQDNLDYKKIELQERVSKLSGKMSLVMMLFLFPALLILLAGPAMLNIAAMLQR